MSKERYCGLVETLRETFRDSRPTTAYPECHILFNEVAFTLAYDLSAEDDVSIYAEFGVVGQELKAEALARFLEANFFSSGYGRPRFGLHPMTGCFLVMLRLPLSQLNLNALIDTMAHISTQVKAQREFMLSGGDDTLRTFSPPA